MIHPEKSSLLLMTEELSKAIPSFNWEEGHSGMILDDITAMQLDELWQDYVERVHVLVEEQDEDIKGIQCYKEKDKGSYPSCLLWLFRRKRIGSMEAGGDMLAPISDTGSCSIH
jgi:hypothetical protein